MIWQPKPYFENSALYECNVGIKAEALSDNPTSYISSEKIILRC